MGRWEVLFLGVIVSEHMVTKFLMTAMGTD